MQLKEKLLDEKCVSQVQKPQLARPFSARWGELRQSLATSMTRPLGSQNVLQTHEAMYRIQLKALKRPFLVTRHNNTVATLFPCTRANTLVGRTTGPCAEGYLATASRYSQKGRALLTEG